MKNVKFLVLISLIMVSCIPDPPTAFYRLPDELISFINSRNIICYKDSTGGGIDTFLISTNTGWAAEQELRYQYLCVFYAKKSQPDYFIYSITRARMGGYFFYRQALFYEKEEVNYLTSQTFSIDFKIDTIVYHLVDTISLKTVFPDEPGKIYSSMYYGIIRYELNDGRVYNLIRK